MHLNVRCHRGVTVPLLQASSVFWVKLELLGFDVDAGLSFNLDILFLFGVFFGGFSGVTGFGAAGISGLVNAVSCRDLADVGRSRVQVTFQ